MPDFPLLLDRTALLVNDLQQRMVEPTSPATLQCGPMTVLALISARSSTVESGPMAHGPTSTAPGRITARSWTMIGPPSASKVTFGYTFADEST